MKINAGPYYFMGFCLKPIRPDSDQASYWNGYFYRAFYYGMTVNFTKSHFMMFQS
jgi:hypothetical protein